MEKDRTASELLNDEATALINEGKPWDALKKLEDAIRKDPDSAVPWYNKGAALMAIGNSENSEGKQNRAYGTYVSAVKAFRQALSLDIAFSEAWNGLGAALFKTYLIDGRETSLESSIEAFDKAMELDKKFADAWANKARALIELGELHEGSGDAETASCSYKEARHACDTAAMLNPEDGEFWLLVGTSSYKLYLVSGKPEFLSESANALDKAFALDRKDLDSLKLKANVLLELAALTEESKGLKEAREQYKKACCILRQLLKLNDKDADAWFDLAFVLMKLGKNKESMDAREKADKLAPGQELNFYQEGKLKFQEAIVFERAGLLDRAIESIRLSLEAFETDLSRKQKNPDAWVKKAEAVLRLGDLMEKQGDRKEAVADYEEALQSADTATFLNKTHPVAWSCKGAALLRLGKLKEAMTSFDKALKLNGNLPRALSGKAEAILRLPQNTGSTRCQEAIALLQRAQKSDSENPRIQANLGFAYYALGDYTKAIREYSLAVLMDPHLADAWYRLWELYSASGKAEKAREAYTHAHNLDPQRFPAMG